jgi:hypothetical protein
MRYRSHYTPDGRFWQAVTRVGGRCFRRKHWCERMIHLGWFIGWVCCVRRYVTWDVTGGMTPYHDQWHYPT